MRVQALNQDDADYLRRCCFYRIFYLLHLGLGAVFAAVDPDVQSMLFHSVFCRQRVHLAYKVLILCILIRKLASPGLVGVARYRPYRQPGSLAASQQPANKLVRITTTLCYVPLLACQSLSENCLRVGSILATSHLVIYQPPHKEDDSKHK